MRPTLPILILTLLTAARGADAQTTIARWDFNSNPPDANPATGALLPSAGAGTLTLIGSVTGSFVDGYSGDAASPGDNSALRLTNFPVQNTASNTAGIQVTVAPGGNPFIVLSWRHAPSSTSPRYAAMQVSFDGGPWQPVSIPSFNGPASLMGVFRPYTHDVTVVVPPAAAAMSLRLVASIFAAIGYAPAQNSGAGYTTTGTWTIDTLEVSARPSRPPYATPLSRIAFAGASPTPISLVGYFGDQDAPSGDAAHLTSIDGSPQFQIADDQVVFTPPAAAALSEPSQDYVGNYTVTDNYGLTATAPITVTVFNPAFCSLTATPPQVVIHCPNSTDTSNIVLTCAPPPGSGGQVLYQWYGDGQRIDDPTPDPTLHLTWYSLYHCAATRTGGTGVCGSGNGSRPVISNPIPIILDYGDTAADVGTAGGIPGFDGRVDNNDFVVFINYFFSDDPIADMGRQGGIPGPDGHLDNNDFVVYIDHFFAHCPN